MRCKNCQADISHRTARAKYCDAKCRVEWNRKKKAWKAQRTPSVISTEFQGLRDKLEHQIAMSDGIKHEQYMDVLREQFNELHKLMMRHDDDFRAGLPHCFQCPDCGQKQFTADKVAPMRCNFCAEDKRPSVWVYVDSLH